MGVRVAYGKKGRISAAIASGTIPKDSLIITSDNKESELYFYDTNGEMKNISERKQFETLTEAQAWVKTYDCAGHIISVHNGSDWVPYIVSADGKLSPVNTGDISVGDVKERRCERYPMKPFCKNILKEESYAQYYDEDPNPSSA